MDSTLQGTHWDKEIAQQSDISPRTLHFWIIRARAEGYREAQAQYNPLLKVCRLLIAVQEWHFLGTIHTDTARQLQQEILDKYGFTDPYAMLSAAEDMAKEAVKDIEYNK